MKKFILPLLTGLTVLTSPAHAYTVKKGDTLNKISKKNDVPTKDTVSMNPKIIDPNKIHVGENIRTITAREKNLMARLVRAEAEGEPYKGKVAVAVVVLNRVDSSEFPNSVTKVINQPGQFEPVMNGQIEKAATPIDVMAVEEALAYDRSKGPKSLFFYNPKTAQSHWLDSKETTAVIGNHTFKK